MKSRTLVWLTAASLLLFTACKNSSSSDTLIPREALMAVNINLESLSSKLSWAEVNKTKWFQDMAKEAGGDSLSYKLLEDPARSGINTRKSLALFLAQRKPRSFYMGWQGYLTDTAAFDKLLHQVGIEGNATFDRSGDINLAYTSEPVVVAWSNSQFLVVSNVRTGAPRFGMMEQYGQFFQPSLLTTDSLKQIAIDLFKRKPDELLGSDKRYADLAADGGDIQWWGNYVSSIFNDYTSGMFSMMKLHLLVENTATATSIRFDNGKITARTRQYLSKEVTELFKEYEPKTITEASMGKLPANDVLAAGAFSYKPEGLKALLQLVGVDGMANGFLGNAGYSVDEFVKANKGEILFAISNFDLQRDSTAYEGLGGQKEYIYRNEPRINFVAGTAVNDKAAFNKLIGILLKESGKIDKALPDVSYRLSDTWFAVASSTGEVDAFLTGGAKPAYASRLAGHHAGFYLNFQRLFNILQTLHEYDKTGMQGERWQSEKEILNTSASFWDEVVTYGDVKKGVLTAYGEVLLKDKNTNSLVQLNSYLDKIYTLRPKKESWDVNDDLTAPPPPQTN